MEAGKDRLARGYSRAAPLYDLLAGPLYVNGLHRMLPHLRVPPAPAILDVGCGTGVNLLEAARLFAPTRLLCGIDLSPGMVEVARAKAAALRVPALFVVGDAEQLPFPDRTFDLVICNSVFHWFKDRTGAAREMCRVLRPGGQVMIICAAAHGFQEWFTFLDALMQAAFGPTAPRSLPNLPTAAEVAGHLLSSGFLIEQLANPTYSQRIHTPEAFIRLMSTVAPEWTADLTPELQLQLEQAAATLMRTGWPQGFPNSWSAVEAVGTRVLP